MSSHSGKTDHIYIASIGLLLFSSHYVKSRRSNFLSLVQQWTKIAMYLDEVTSIHVSIRVSQDGGVIDNAHLPSVSFNNGLREEAGTRTMYIYIYKCVGILWWNPVVALW